MGSLSEMTFEGSVGTAGTGWGPAARGSAGGAPAGRGARGQPSFFEARIPRTVCVVPENLVRLKPLRCLRITSPHSRLCGYLKPTPVVVSTKKKKPPRGPAAGRGARGPAAGRGREGPAAAGGREGAVGARGAAPRRGVAGGRLGELHDHPDVVAGVALLPLRSEGQARRREGRPWVRATTRPGGFESLHAEYIYVRNKWDYPPIRLGSPACGYFGK